MLYIQNYKNTKSSLQEFIIYAHSEKRIRKKIVVISLNFLIS